MPKKRRKRCKCSCGGDDEPVCDSLPSITGKAGKPRKGYIIIDGVEYWVTSTNRRVQGAGTDTGVYKCPKGRRMVTVYDCATKQIKEMDAEVAKCAKRGYVYLFKNGKPIPKKKSCDPCDPCAQPGMGGGGLLGGLGRESGSAEAGSG